MFYFTILYKTHFCVNLNSHVEAPPEKLKKKKKKQQQQNIGQLAYCCVYFSIDTENIV